MAYHSDTHEMDVTVDGVATRRGVANVCRVRLTGFMGPHHYLVQHEPELLEGEVCTWTVGSAVPDIRSTRPG